MKSFNKLTTRGQALRIRNIALKALDHYDLQIKRISLLSANFNMIFRLDAENGEKYILRVNLPGHRTEGNIHAEMTWLDALCRETDLSVPRPSRTKKGELVVKESADGVPEPRFCTVFGWVSGSDLARNITPERYERLGKLTAQLHNHAASWSPGEALELDRLDRVLLLGGDTPIWESDRAGALMPAGRAEVFRAVFEKTSSLLDQLYASAGKPSILHADLHQGNVRFNRNLISVLDFDDCALGHFVQDVGTTFYYVLGYPDHDALRQAYRKGYESVRSWPAASPCQLEGIIAARGLLLSQVLFQLDNPLYEKILPRVLDQAEKRFRKYLEEC